MKTPAPATTTETATTVSVYLKGCAKAPASVAQFDTLVSQIPKVSVCRQVDNAGELLGLVKQGGQSVIILCVSDKNDLVEVVNFLQALQPKTLASTVRVLAFNAIEIQKIHTLLTSKGCNDILAPSLSRQGLIRKIHYNVNVLEAANKKDRQMQRLGGAKGQAAEAGGAKEAQIQWTPALEMAADCWLLRKKDVKCVIGNWFIELIGPGPSAGSWKSVVADATEEERFWEWVPRAGAPETLIPVPGKWQINCKMPEFLWKVNRYKIIGKTPELKFVHADGKTQWRFKPIAGGGFQVCENSEIAKGKLPVIETTFETSIVIKQEKDKKGGDVVMNDDEAAAREWNEGDLSKDEAAEWGGDGTREKAKPGGRGVGQGQGGNKGYKHEKESFGKGERLEDAPAYSTGADAFVGMELSALVYPKMDATQPPLVCEMLEQTDQTVILDIPEGLAQPGEKLLADLVCKAEKVTKIRVELRADTLEPSDNQRQLLFATIMGGNVAALKAMVSDYVERQAEILKFLQDAKGY